MVSGVAHDFGNLLTPILSYSDELIDDFGGEQKSLKPEEIVENLEGIRDAAQDGTELIKRLRASYITKDHLRSSKSEIEVSKLFHSSLKLALPRWDAELPSPTIEIEIEGDGDLWRDE